MAAFPAGGKRRLAGHGYACDRWRRSVRHRPPLSWDPRTQTPSPLGSPARCSPDTPRCGDSTADLGPQYARGRGERAAPEGAERRLSGAPRSLRPLGPGPSVLLCARWREGVGAGPSEVDFSRLNRTATASARHRCGCQAGRLARKQVLAAPGAASRPGARCTALGAPRPPTLPPQPLAWAGHCGPSSVAGTVKAPGRSRGPMGPPAGRCPRSLSDQGGKWRNPAPPPCCPELCCLW